MAGNNQALWGEYWAPDPEAPDASVSDYLTRRARDDERETTTPSRVFVGSLKSTSR